MDKIFIRDLLVRGIVGINPDERVERQDIVVNVVMWTDKVGKAAAADDVTLSINYKEVADAIVGHVEASRNLAVETLAVDIADLILTRFAAERVRVTVEKPSALNFARSVGIEIERDLS